MAEAKKTSKKVLELISLLSKPEAKTQIKAIQDLKIHGNESAIEPLVSLYIETKNNAIKTEIEGLLNTLKVDGVQPFIVDCLINDDFADAQQMLLSSIWNSNLDYSDYLNEIVETAVNGDFMTAMECLTIFENLEVQLSEEQIMPPLLTINQYLNDNNGEDSPKHQLLTEVAVFLNRLNQAL
jgi:hypothetical protein